MESPAHVGASLQAAGYQTLGELQLQWTTPQNSIHETATTWKAQAVKKKMGTVGLPIR